MFLAPAEPGPIKEIPMGAVCSNARFVFDRTITLQAHDYLELKDGQFWLHGGASIDLLDGKWGLCCR
jgi:hypothetical protein